MMKAMLRAATPGSRLYCQPQSHQISMQTGCVGQMRVHTATGDTVWKDRFGSPKTEAVESELERLVSDLLTEQPSIPPEGLCCSTGQYTYLIGTNPAQAGYQIFCYRRDWLEQHMKQAEKGIRFITPNYRERFRIADGDMVRIRREDGTALDFVCRYIDDTHLEVSGNLYHICQFAEIMERNGNTVIPLRSSLPEKCFSVLPGSDTLIVITKGEMGYDPAGMKPTGVTVQEGADAANEAMGVTKAQETAMLAGSMLGWDTPAADPKNDEEQGQRIHSRHRERGDAR